MLTPGTAIPAGELEGLGGESLRLGPDSRERDLLLVFFKISCPTCQLALPFLDRLHRGAAEQVEVCLVSQDDAASTAAFLRHFGLSAPAFLDRAEADYPVSNAFGIHYVPSLFWINRQGLIEAALHGFHRADYAALAARAGARIFDPGEPVPEWRAG
jgi:peroxiredoxin